MHHTAALPSTGGHETIGHPWTEGRGFHHHEDFQLLFRMKANKYGIMPYDALSVQYIGTYSRIDLQGRENCWQVVGDWPGEDQYHYE